MASRLKEKLRQNHLVRVFCLGQLCSPKLVEMIAWGGGYDALWLDQEHGGLSMSQLEESARAARGADIDTFVRLAATDYATTMRPMEAGAGGIMAAQVRTAAEAEQIVRWCKFHPRGERGINNTGAEGRYGRTPLLEYMKQANENTFIAIQIENASAVEEVEKIAAVPDIDILFVGPADLSQSLGIPADWDHPRHWQAVERVANAAAKHGVHWATLPLNKDYARRCIDLGCTMLSLGIDVWIINQGLKAFQEEYSEFFA
jgi:2-keto-3-deoxy-L-rhamnonate aldolase RhmA